MSWWCVTTGRRITLAVVREFAAKVSFPIVTLRDRRRLVLHRFQDLCLLETVRPN
jgi:hypothetical protein